MVGVTLKAVVLALVGAALPASVPHAGVCSPLASAVAAYRSAVTSPPFRVSGALLDLAVVQASPRGPAAVLVLEEARGTWRLEQRVTLRDAGELAPGRFSAASPHAPEWVTPVTLRGPVHAAVFDELEAGGWTGVVLASRHGRWGVAPVSGSGTSMLENPEFLPPASLTTAALDCDPNCATGGFIDRRFRFDATDFAFRPVGIPRHVGATAAPRLAPGQA